MEGLPTGAKSAPSALRNRDPIWAVLEPHLTKNAHVLEVACGSGEHAVHFAKLRKDVFWQCSDIDDENLVSVSAWSTSLGVPLPKPIHLDVHDDVWFGGVQFDAVVAINLIHISPLSVTPALIEGAARQLRPKGLLYLYGPYKRDGDHTAESNQAFDHWLKEKDPSYGVRDMEWVTKLAAEAGFSAPDTVPMPANNFSLVFKRG